MRIRHWQASPVAPANAGLPRYAQGVATRQFGLTTVVAARPEYAIDFLMDLRRQRGLHPFVVSADIVASGTTNAQPWFRWRIHERPTLGPIRYSIRFTATMHRAPTTMTANVAAAPGCSLTSRTTAHTALDGPLAGTVMHEVTTVTAPRLLLGYMWTQAHTAHASVYEHLPAELAAP